MILVTGHMGYIGSHVYNKLVDMGYNVRGIDLKNGEDIAHCLPDEKYDYVFHLAALPKVQYSVENPSYTMKQNVLTTSVLLEWAKNNGVKRVIFSSSCAAAGNGNGPTSPYGLHKLISEMECKLYAELYDLDTVCLRYYNVYSENQKYGDAYSTVICAWMEMIRQGRPLRLDGDGTQTRDFIHVDDIVLANIFCMNHEASFNGKVLNVGSGTSVSMNYIKSFVDQYHDVEWVRAPVRKGDIAHVISDLSEIKKLGWKPSILINKGLTKCFKRSLENE